MSERTSYPYVNLPDYYVKLLRSNMQSTSKSFSGLRSTVYDNKGFFSIVSHAFRDIDPLVRIDRIINSLGWLGFRDRLACLFLHYQKNRKFPKSVDLSLVDELLSFERQLKGVSVEGHSRGFLLAFYLKMSRIKEGADEEDVALIKVDQEIMKTLRKSQSREISLDWMILIIHHFILYLGKKNFDDCLKKKCSYEELYEMLDDEKRRKMMKNLLVYGASIGESLPFIETKV